MPRWGPAQRVLVGIVMLGLGALGFTVGRTMLRPTRAIPQPIAFNHQLHVEALDCDTCHEYVQTRTHSGLPGLSICLQCHEEPLTDEPEERQIVALAQAGQEQVFRKLFRLPDNVYYTHRRHVGIARLECSTCHGAIEQATSPPAVPLQTINMDFCVKCHRASGVRAECTACHR